jgi:hypothetical protein
MWYGDFTTIAHTSQQASGGKGFGGGTTKTTSYTYTAAVAMGACEGPIAYFANVWDTSGVAELVDANETYTVPGGGGSYSPVYNAPLYYGNIGCGRVDSYYVVADDYGSDGPVTLSGFMTTPMQPVAYGDPILAGQYSMSPSSPWVYYFSGADAGKQISVQYKYVTAVTAALPPSEVFMTDFNGARPQTPWSYLTSAHPTQALGYTGIAYLANSDFDLGSSGELPNLNWEVLGIGVTGGGLLDADPSFIIYDMLTSVYYGASFNPSYIGDMSAMQNYCYANGILLSPVFDSQDTHANQLQTILDIVNTAAFWSEGKLKFVPAGEKTVAGNGYVFVPDTYPKYFVCDNDYIRTGTTAPVQVAVKDPADAMNVVAVEYIDRSNDYNVSTVEVKNEANINVFGEKRDDVRTMHPITSAAVAQLVADTYAKQNVYLNQTFKFTLGLQYCRIEPMDVIALNDSVLGLVNTPVRISSVTEKEDGTYEFEAYQFIFGSSSPTGQPVQSGSGYQPNGNADPGNVLPPIIFEANDRLALNPGEYEVWIGICGQLTTWAGATVWMAVDGVTYKQVGRIYGAARMGYTTTVLPASSDPDTTHSVGVQLQDIGGVLLSGTASDCNNYRTLCFFRTPSGAVELISYQTATLLGPQQYQLGTLLRRGVFGSPIESFPASSNFLRLDQAIFVLPVDPTLVGSTMSFKFTSFNELGTQEQDIANVTAYTFVFNGSYNNFGQFVGNDATVDSIGTGGPPFTAATVRAYGPSGISDPIEINKSDGTVTNIGPFTFPGQALATGYYVMWDPGFYGTAYAYLLTSYAAMTQAVYNGHICLGYVFTVDASGSGGQGGGGGGIGGGGCPAMGMMLDEHTCIGAVVAGTWLDCVNTVTGEVYAAQVEATGVSLEPCVRLVFSNGAVWEGSESTPFELPTGETVYAFGMAGKQAWTDSGPSTPTELSTAMQAIRIGKRWVGRISIGGRTFACGKAGSKRVYSHNTRKP